jgi:uncharacterized protein (DUF2141 family)
MRAKHFFLGLGLALGAPTVAHADMLGSDRAACTAGGGSAIRVNVLGLKDRTGRLKLELYPATEDDFLKDDRDLKKEGKFFRRIWADTPAGEGQVSMCIKAPKPGRYALLFTHDRDGKNKFNFWRDGAGFPSNHRLGRSRPDLAEAIIEVGSDMAVTNIRVQYMRGLGGFSPLNS